jgi:hypothetical protein
VLDAEQLLVVAEKICSGKGKKRVVSIPPTHTRRCRGVAVPSTARATSMTSGLDAPRARARGGVGASPSEASRTRFLACQLTILCDLGARRACEVPQLRQRWYPGISILVQLRDPNPCPPSPGTAPEVRDMASCPLVAPSADHYLLTLSVR